tara:strand:+ start:1755 stop:1874 length:120 start_codon:yes stop_codon:yes gene_type:complete
VGELINAKENENKLKTPNTFKTIIKPLAYLTNQGFMFFI